jgi:hypothetical protein
MFCLVVAALDAESRAWLARHRKEESLGLTGPGPAGLDDDDQSASSITIRCEDHRRQMLQSLVSVRIIQNGCPG